LRSADFRRVYDQGSRYSGPLFAAFYVHRPDCSGPKIGFTVPRAIGKATVRNRVKRRVREAIRLRLDQLNSQCEVVINPRRRLLDATFPEIEREVERLFLRCAGS
jgi:ribonuclease P protein component